MFCGIKCPICYSRRVQKLGSEYRCKACYNRWDTEAGSIKKIADIMEKPKGVDLVDHLNRQREFSLRTFGPGAHTSGVLDNIRKELLEIEIAPQNLTKWVKVVILALDGAWRSGHTPEEITRAIEEKRESNDY